MSKSKKSNFPIWKIVVSIIWDLLDFTIFRIPVLGTITDLISIPIAVKLWGNLGYVSAWELADVTDQLDAEVPTMTIIGILSYLKE